MQSNLSQHCTIDTNNSVCCFHNGLFCCDGLSVSKIEMKPNTHDNLCVSVPITKRNKGEIKGCENGMDDYVTNISFTWHPQYENKNLTVITIIIHFS